MNELIFLAHRIPYPPVKGDKIRSFHWLRALASRYRVHLGTFVDDPRDWSGIAALEPLCASVQALPLGRTRASWRSLAALPAGQPMTVPYYADRRLHAWMNARLERRPPEAIVVYSSSMAQYVPDSPGCRTVLDLCDVDSDKWRQYAARRSVPMRWVYEREARRLADYEERQIERFDATLVVSRAEAQLLRGWPNRRVLAVANGVDVEHFSPAREYANPYAPDEAAIVFTGAMDYWPNIEAARWFAGEVLPILARSHPAARFYVVGSNPAAAVRALARNPRVHVTGWVDDVRPYIAHARMAVAPLHVARGVQNKVLEAMAMGRPVLATSAALRGIDQAPLAGIVAASGAGEWATAARALLEGGDAERLGAAGRRYVMEHYPWSLGEAQLLEAVAGESSEARARDLRVTRAERHA